MTARTPHRTAPLVALAGLGLVLGACGGDDGGDTAPSAVTLPDQLVPGSSVPDPAPTTAPTTAPATSSTTTPPAGAGHGLDGVPDPTGAPAVADFAISVPASCSPPSVAGQATFTVGPGPEVTTVRFFLGTDPLTSEGAGTSWTVDGIPCDGVVHSVTMIAVAPDGTAATRSAAVRSTPSGT